LSQSKLSKVKVWKSKIEVRRVKLHKVGLAGVSLEEQNRSEKSEVTQGDHPRLSQGEKRAEVRRAAVGIN
jgi:hypothetical protein